MKNLLITKDYTPPQATTLPLRDDLARSFLAGNWTAEELLQRYCMVIYAQSGSYEEAARRMQLDWRTIKAKVDPELLEQLQPALPTVTRNEASPPLSSRRRARPRRAHSGGKRVH